MAYKSIIKKIFKSIIKASKDEVQEIKSITPSEEQYNKGKVLGAIAIAALASAGIPVAAVAEPIIAKVFAYGIADLEAGIQDDKKLIVERVLNELKKS